MNTREKIRRVDDTPSLEAPVLLVTGHFDILRVETVRGLTEARQRTGARTVVAALKAFEGELAPVEARAEMAAALRVVDYVFIAGNEDWDKLAAQLQPVETIHLEEADRRRIRQLSEDVRSRPIR